MMNKIQIFAYKYEGEFYAEHIIEDLESEFDRLEYGDVFEGEFQIWEYPSGKIFNIEPDRKVDDKDYYSVRFRTEGTVWLPKLTLLTADKKKVAEAYKRLSNPAKNL